MELIDRYLGIVRDGMTGAGSEDILAELSENLYARVEDRERELGRPLTVAEVEALFWPEKVTFGPFQLGPVWHSLYVPFVAITLVYVAQAVVNLVRPDWSRLRTGVSVFVTAVWMGMLVFALQMGNWAVISDPGAATADMQKGLEAVNRFVFYYSILGALFGAGIALVIDLVKLLRRPRPAPQAVAA